MNKAEEILNKVKNALSATEKDIWADLDLPQYHIVCTRPVKILRSENGRVEMLKFDWDTGGFVDGNNLWADVFLSHGGDVEQVTEEEFIQYIEELRGRRLKGEGTVYTLYEVINAVQDRASAEGRRLTEQERALIAGLRRETYALFEKTLEARKSQEPDSSCIHT